MKALMILVMFFLIGAFFIISENDLHLNEKEELKQFNTLYTAWVNGIFDNLKQVTSYVVKMDWLPEDE